MPSCIVQPDISEWLKPSMWRKSYFIFESLDIISVCFIISLYITIRCLKDILNDISFTYKYKEFDNNLNVAFFAMFHANYLLPNAMRCSQHPLIGNKDSCTIEDLLRATKKGCKKRPITRSWLHTTHYSLHSHVSIHGTSAAASCSRIDHRTSKKNPGRTLEIFNLTISLYSFPIIYHIWRK